MNVFDFNQDDIKKCISENRLVLVEFMVDNCWLCKIGLISLKRLASYFGDKVVVGKIDIDDATQYKIDLEIKTTPMMVLFKDGFPVFKISGVRPTGQISDRINEFI